MFMPFHLGAERVLEVARSKEIVPGAVSDNQSCPIAGHVAQFLEDCLVGFHCPAIMSQIHARGLIQMTNGIMQKNDVKGSALGVKVLELDRMETDLSAA